MADYSRDIDPNYVPPPRVPRKAVAEKARRLAYRGEKGPLEKGKVVQYAMDFDDIARDGWRHSDEPPTANLEPVREMYSVPVKHDQATQIKHYQDLAKYRNHGSRTPVVLRRTVTYGPWEQVEIND